jgi:hypothetical protein
MRLLSLALAVVALSGLASASEEEFLEWSEVRIVAPEREDTGKVAFSARIAGDKYHEVKIEAFGKEFTLDKEHRAALDGFPLNSLRLTHEAGYERLGGHTVSCQLKKTHYDAEKRLVEDRVVISVTKTRGLALTGPKRRVIKE